MKSIFSKREKLALLLLLVLFFINYILIANDVFAYFPIVDVPLHFLGGFLVALFFVDYFRRALIAERSLAGDLAVIVGVTLLIGIGWEIFEFVLDRVLSPQPAMTLFDTLKDLVVDSIGAAAMLLIVRHRHRKSALFK